jgi:hypothetical protein
MSARFAITGLARGAMTLSSAVLWRTSTPSMALHGYAKAPLSWDEYVETATMFFGRTGSR